MNLFIQSQILCFILCTVFLLYITKLNCSDSNKLFLNIGKINILAIFFNIIHHFTLEKIGNIFFVLYILTNIVIAALWCFYICSTHAKKDVLTVFIPFICATILEIFIPDIISVIPYSNFLILIILFINNQNNKLLTDNLTHLKNRYGMDDEINEQLEQYKKDNNDSFYVIVCDMDNFKHINDTWGHQEGDRALKMIAETLTEISQKHNSTTFRYGGDEFVIITDTSENDLPDKICSEIKSALKKLPFREDFEIRMSMGISLYDGKKTISELINCADCELYEEKKQKS